MTRINFVLILAILLLLPSFADAQRDGNKFRDRLENLRKDKLISDIQLTEDQAQNVIDANVKHRRNMRTLFNTKNELEAKMLSEKNSPGLNIIIGDFLNTYTEMASEKVRYYNELKSFLSEEKFAEVVNFQTKFDENLRKEVRKHKRNKNRDR